MTSIKPILSIMIQVNGVTFMIGNDQVLIVLELFTEYDWQSDSTLFQFRDPTMCNNSGPTTVVVIWKCLR